MFIVTGRFFVAGEPVLAGILKTSQGKDKLHLGGKEVPVLARASMNQISNMEKHLEVLDVVGCLTLC